MDCAACPFTVQALRLKLAGGIVGGGLLLPFSFEHWLHNTQIPITKIHLALLFIDVVV
jgi:hypothetical protein